MSFLTRISLGNNQCLQRDKTLCTIFHDGLNSKRYFCHIVWTGKWTFKQFLHVHLKFIVIYKYILNQSKVQIKMDLFHSIVFTSYFTITCYDTIQKLYINYLEVKSIWKFAHKLIMYIITNIGVYLVWTFSLWNISSQASESILVFDCVLNV